MKLSIKSLAVLSLSILFASCTGDLKTVDTPEDIGPQAFAILEDMDDMNEEQFGQHFLTIEDIHAIAKDKELGLEPDITKEILSHTKEKRQEEIAYGFKNLKEKGKEMEIDWAQIEYKEFEPHLRTKDGLKDCKGELWFTYKKKTFRVNTHSIYNGSGYSLLRIESLMEDE